LVSLAFGLRRSTERPGIPGFWVTFFERAVHQDPAGCVAVMCHLVTVRRCCLRASESRGQPVSIFSRLTSHGSLARVPTHRRARCRPASTLSPACPS